MIVVPAAAAQAAIAREHGRSSWAGLKQACTQESHTVVVAFAISTVDALIPAYFKATSA
jgi:hypothetical protein